MLQFAKVGVVGKERDAEVDGGSRDPSIAGFQTIPGTASVIRHGSPGGGKLIAIPNDCTAGDELLQMTDPPGTPACQKGAVTRLGHYLERQQGFAFGELRLVE